MRITHQSRDLLVIHRSAAARRLIGAVVATFGIAAFWFGVVNLAWGLIQEMPRDEFLDSLGCTSVAGLLIAEAGAALFLYARDKDYRFWAAKQQLSVHWRSGEEVIPFARIVTAEVYAGGEDSDAYGLRLKLRDPDAEMNLTTYLYSNDAYLRKLAESINRILKAQRHEFDPVSVDLAGADFRAAAKVVFEKLWGQPRTPPELSDPVPRDGPVLFVCPECAWQTDNPVGPLPYECERCRRATGAVVHLQNRTPGRVIVVRCACGQSFSVPRSFAGMQRPCPKCRQKCHVPNESGPTTPSADRQRSEPIDPTAFRGRVIA